MDTRSRKGRVGERGFTFVEVLTTVLVIAILVMVSVYAFGKVFDDTTSAAKRNAQSICTLYNHALLAGAEFGTTDEGEIIDALIAGITGPLISGSVFRISPLNAEEKAAVLLYCDHDETSQMMLYYPEGVGGQQP